jgi:hypothetical protein
MIAAFTRLHWKDKFPIDCGFNAVTFFVNNPNLTWRWRLD